MTTGDRPGGPDPPPASVADLAELGELFEQNWLRLVEVVRRRIDPALERRIDPEGVVNQAYLDARRKRPAYQAGRPVSPFVWLYRIVRDRLAEEWRAALARGRDVRRDLPWPDRPSAQLGLRLVGPGETPSGALIRSERERVMGQALGLLADAEREVVMLRNYEGLSFREIGELLGVTENAAAQRHVRALRRLRAVWQRLTGESRP